MNYKELYGIMESFLQEGKGILAADESTATIGKRFENINLDNTEKHRHQYRLLLATTPNLEQYIHSIILFEETFTQCDSMGISIPELLLKKGILPGIKIDKGLTLLANTEEHVTQGLDNLAERLTHFKSLGAKFAKWRAVYSISNKTPSTLAIKAGAETLARYAACCQYLGLIPIVEPEVLMDGDHSIDYCAEISALVLHEVFNALFLHGVALEYMILKPSMITSGKDHKPFSTAEDVRNYTLHILRNHVPSAVPSINFLSGGQSAQTATLNLNALNHNTHQPWSLSFSFGRALQDDCLKVWGGKEENVAVAQAALLKRAKLNSLATLGRYETRMEKE